MHIESGRSAAYDVTPQVKQSADGKPLDGKSDGESQEGRRRVVIEEVQPQVDFGRYPVKRTLGDTVTVTAAVFGDGHDHVAGRLLYRHAGNDRWQSVPFEPLTNDLWQAKFVVDRLGEWHYTLEAWIDHIGTWYSDLLKRIAPLPDAGKNGASTRAEDVALALRSGALLVKQIAARAEDRHRASFLEIAAELSRAANDEAAWRDSLLSDEFAAAAGQYPDPDLVTHYQPQLRLWVDRTRARYSTWYELFPRSASSEPTRHGTFEDVEALLPRIAGMGFDVLYLPPIHPIGGAFRKGKNNSVAAAPGDPGSPWAIGARDGGHTAIHRQLGTENDFKKLAARARSLGMELVLDIAFQCSPDHPWVAAHLEWFVIRPDGTIQYAENPPKKYQDIYPLNFESSDWRGLWTALRDVFLYWAERDVRIFRVDNPHTKALPFWEWCIEQIHAHYPDAIFLAEAFTRPHVMYSLAKSGFTQSYTYFTWRNSKDELQQYFTEITKPPVSDFFRPNLWPNTPDILPPILQTGGRPAFVQRLILAATLGANYGIYGPAFEHCEHTPAKPGSEEYLDSEKYEIRNWIKAADYGMAEVLTQVNTIRRENTALQSDTSLHFHRVDNPNLLCYSKASDGNRILMVVNLDPVYEQSGWTDLDLNELNLPYDVPFEVEDLLTGARYPWRGPRNYVALRPHEWPAHILRFVERAKEDSRNSSPSQLQKSQLDV